MQITANKETRSFGIKIEAKEAGQLLGWAYVYIMYNDLHEEPFGFLENVFVNEEYRSKGIGRELVEKVIEEAKKEKCYKLIGNSRYSKPEVHAFYEKLGFKDHGKEFRMDL